MERVAFLIEESNDQIRCLLNPESLVIHRLAGVRPRRSIGGDLTGRGLSDDPLIFTGGGRMEIHLDLLFDVTLAGSSITTRNVRELTAPFWNLAENSSRLGYGQPPQVRFLWGKFWDIPGVVLAVSEHLEQFTADGTAQRSWLRMRLLRVNETLRTAATPASAAPLPADFATLDPARMSDQGAQVHAVVGGGMAPVQSTPASVPPATVAEGEAPIGAPPEAATAASDALAPGIESTAPETATIDGGTDAATGDAIVAPVTAGGEQPAPPDSVPPDGAPPDAAPPGIDLAIASPAEIAQTLQAAETATPAGATAGQSTLAAGTEPPASETPPPGEADAPPATAGDLAATTPAEAITPPGEGALSTSAPDSQPPTADTASAAAPGETVAPPAATGDLATTTPAEAIMPPGEGAVATTALESQQPAADAAPITAAPGETVAPPAATGDLAATTPAETITPPGEGAGLTTAAESQPPAADTAPAADAALATAAAQPMPEAVTPPSPAAPEPASAPPAEVLAPPMIFGERLDQIAYRYYGDPRYWRLLALANAIDDPLHISPGRLLRIPAVIVGKAP